MNSSEHPDDSQPAESAPQQNNTSHDTADATLVETAVLAPRPDPVWRALMVTILAIIGALAAGGLAIPLGMLLTDNVDALIVPSAAVKSPGEIETYGPDIESIIADILAHPAGMWMIVLPGQIAFLAFTFFAASRSRYPFRERLWMQQGRYPKWTWFVFAVATPVIAFASGILVQGLMNLLDWEPSDQLKMIEELLTGQSGFAFLMLILLISVVPGVCEELLFRGYLQSRLHKRWSPAAAIFVSALIFALAHVDPMHAVGVLPLGIWLGIVAWKTDSVWPGVLCHAYSNGLATVAAQLGGESEQLTSIHFFLVAPSILAMMIGIPLLTRTPKQADLA